MSLPDRYKVNLLVSSGAPAGVEGVAGEDYPWQPDWSDWAWAPDGGALNLVTAPDGAKWGFVPAYRQFCVRPTDAGVTMLAGTIEMISAPDEWQGLVNLHLLLEHIRLRELEAGNQPAAQINKLIAASLDAAVRAYHSILINECPWMSSLGALYVDGISAADICSMHFRGNPDGSEADMDGAILWQCHRLADHDGDHSAARSAVEHCCTPSTFPSTGFAWPYERASYWEATTASGPFASIINPAALRA